MEKNKITGEGQKPVLVFAAASLKPVEYLSCEFIGGAYTRSYSKPDIFIPGDSTRFYKVLSARLAVQDSDFIKKIESIYEYSGLSWQEIAEVLKLTAARSIHLWRKKEREPSISHRNVVDNFFTFLVENKEKFAVYEIRKFLRNELLINRQDLDKIDLEAAAVWKTLSLEFLEKYNLMSPTPEVSEKYYLSKEPPAPINLIQNIDIVKSKKAKPSIRPIKKLKRITLPDK